MALYGARGWLLSGRKWIASATGACRGCRSLAVRRGSGQRRTARGSYIVRSQRLEWRHRWPPRVWRVGGRVVIARGRSVRRRARTDGGLFVSWGAGRRVFARLGDGRGMGRVAIVTERVRRRWRRRSCLDRCCRCRWGGADTRSRRYRYRLSGRRRRRRRRMMSYL